MKNSNSNLHQRQNSLFDQASRSPRSPRLSPWQPNDLKKIFAKVRENYEVNSKVKKQKSKIQEDTRTQSSSTFKKKPKNLSTKSIYRYKSPEIEPTAHISSKLFSVSPQGNFGFVSSFGKVKDVGGFSRSPKFHETHSKNRNPGPGTYTVPEHRRSVSSVFSKGEVKREIGKIRIDTLPPNMYSPRFIDN